jgi:AcrR family transcriptional regulator
MFTPVNIRSMSSQAPYHHGDLRNALIGAAAELAGQGGPDAVTIRAAARKVGVTPTAAYRHFAGHEDLLTAAKDLSLDRMADAMRNRLAALAPDPDPDPARAAMARLEAMGRGYVDFALSEPGLFRTAFCRNPNKALDLSALDGPHTMLTRSVDDLIAVGFFREEARLGAEISAWSLVHGLSMLLLDGPLANLPAVEQQAVVDQTIDTFTRSFWSARANLQGE